jgi:hypothetical protein
MALGDYIRSCNNFQLAVLFSQLDNIKNVAEKGEFVVDPTQIGYWMEKMEQEFPCEGGDTE